MRTHSDTGLMTARQEARGNVRVSYFASRGSTKVLTLVSQRGKGVVSTRHMCWYYENNRVLIGFRLLVLDRQCSL